MGIRESCPKNSKRRFLLFFMERDRDGGGGGGGGGWSDGRLFGCHRI